MCKSTTNLFGLRSCSTTPQRSIFGNNLIENNNNSNAPTGLFNFNNQPNNSNNLFSTNNNNSHFSNTNNRNQILKI